MLQQLATLAAGATGSSAALVSLVGRRGDAGGLTAAHGLSDAETEIAIAAGEALQHYPGLTVITDLTQDRRVSSFNAVAVRLGLRFMAHHALVSPGGDRIGFLAVFDPNSRSGLTSEQAALLGHVAGLLVADRQRSQRHAHLMYVANRALRVDQMLRQVSEAQTCADALCNLLTELCRHHGAVVGRIFQVTPVGDHLQEISLYQNGAPADGTAGPPPSRPVHGDISGWAILRNEKRATIYGQSALPDGCSLREDDVEAGLTSQIDVPIWVEQQRFGITLAFTTDRADLAAVVADIASLADTIRPALFRKVTEERLRFVAHHDDLTQLANRPVFHDRLASAMAGTSVTEAGLALLYLDLDGFKLINDSLGHEAGDQLLAAVATRLRAVIGPRDTVARIGGDEFAIIQPATGQPQAAARLADRVLATIRQPFTLDGHRAMVGVSIGVAVHPRDGDTPDLLLRSADTALYRAKEAGRNTYRLFEPAMGVRQQERLLIEQELKVAIAGQQFDLAYQPICDAASLEVLGFEALLRWRHPQRGQIEPGRFVPLAETTGLIVPLGRWVLEHACQEAVAWSTPASVSVNLSPRQFRQPDLPQQIAAILHRTGLAPERIDLEVTEGLLLDDSGLVLNNMRALREQGIRITLDDFGTAYASLSYLRRFPFDRIKIDKSFVQGMCDDDATLAIVETILTLSSRLNLAVVAEGVETPSQLDATRALGCRLVQGFFTGRPMPAERARALLAAPGARLPVDAPAPIA